MKICVIHGVRDRLDWEAVAGRVGPMELLAMSAPISHHYAFKPAGGYSAAELKKKPRYKGADSKHVSGCGEWAMNSKISYVETGKSD